MKPRELVLKVAGFAGGVITVALMTWAAGWTGAQVLATTIFLGFILGTLLFWQFRLGFAMVGVLALLATGVLDVPHLIEFASLDVILFLIGMMIVIAFLEKRRFFEVMVERILRRVDRRAWHLLTAFMVMGAVSAALVDEVTSILFMTAVDCSSPGGSSSIRCRSSSCWSSPRTSVPAPRWWETPSAS